MNRKIPLPPYTSSSSELTLNTEVVSRGSVIITRYGRLRILDGIISIKSGGTWQTIATLDSQDFPKKQLDVVCGAYGYTGTAEINIKPKNGVIAINCSAPGSYLKFQVSYMVK